MIKFFRKIRQNLLSEGKTGKYFKYAIGEIVLLVIGILVALQINNWNTRRIENQEERQIYLQIKNKIEDDKIEFERTNDINNYLSQQSEKANTLISNKNYGAIDTLAYLTIQLSQYSDFQRNGKLHENLINSGDIKLLQNQDIISQLQNLELTYNSVNKLEDIHWEIIIKELSPELKGVINYSSLEVIKPDKLYAVEMQNLFFESIYLTKGKDSIYRKAIKEINDIIALIDTETELKK
jgi:hypothetical protein